MYTPKVNIVSNFSNAWGDHYTVSILEIGAKQWQELDIGKIVRREDEDECSCEFFYYNKDSTVLNYHIIIAIANKLKELNGK